MDTKKIRAKLLDLAVRGKLVPQDPTDEPASALLNRIREERAKLIEEKKVKAPKDGDSVIYLASDGSRYEKRGKREPVCVDDEIPFDVPEGWEWARLESVAYVAAGKTPSKDSFVEDGVPYFKMYNLRGQKIDFDFRPQYIRPEVHYETLAKSRIHPGDLIMNIVGPPLGKLAIVPERFPEANTNQAAVVIRPDSSGIPVKWLFYYLSEMTAINRIATRGSAGQVNISLTQSKAMLVPVPPLAEQLRIVAELDRLLALVDGVERDSADLDALRARARSKVLDLAVRGLLAPQGASDEPAGELLARAAEERARLVREGRARAPKGGLSVIECRSDGRHYEKRGSGDPVPVEVPYDLPEGWAWARLLNLCYLNPKIDAPDDVHAAFLPMAAIDDGFANSYHSVSRSWGEIKKGFTQFADGDVVFAKISPCFENGKYFIARNLPNGIGAGTTELYVLRPVANSLLSEFLFLYLESPLFVQGACKTFMGTVGQQRIKRDYIEDALIPVPPLSEQRHIVNRVELILSFFTNL